MTDSPLRTLMHTLADHTQRHVLLCAPYLNAYAQPTLLFPALIWVVGAGRYEQESAEMLGWCRAAGGQRWGHRHFPGLLLGMHPGDVTTLLAQAAIPEDRLAIDHTGQLHDQREVVTRQLGAPNTPLWTGTLPRVISRHDLDRHGSPLGALQRSTPESPTDQVMLSSQPPFLWKL